MLLSQKISQHFYNKILSSSDGFYCECSTSPKKKKKKKSNTQKKKKKKKFTTFFTIVELANFY